MRPHLLMFFLLPALPLLCRAQPGADARAIEELVARMDRDIEARSSQAGQQQMTVTLEVSQNNGELLKRIVRYAHDPVPVVYGEDARLYRVIVDYLHSDSLHVSELYYFFNDDVFFVELQYENNDCRGTSYYFRNRKLIQLAEWEGSNTQCGILQAPEATYLAAKGLPEPRMRDALFRQIQAREYLAAFLAFSRTLQKQGR
ncbi:MAG: hypothetical protein KF690_08255 [Bacteroidetes bacterium]|nr:hypothetical protein [Bacteroidota bacterium]